MRPSPRFMRALGSKNKKNNVRRVEEREQEEEPEPEPEPETEEGAKRQGKRGRTSSAVRWALAGGAPSPKSSTARAENHRKRTGERPAMHKNRRNENCTGLAQIMGQL